MSTVGLQGSAVSTGQLSGTIIPKVYLRGTIIPKVYLRGKACVPDKFDTYDGDYIVTPRLNEQTLATKDKNMIDDVVVKPIPIYELSNEHGITVIIGGELDV